MKNKKYEQFSAILSTQSAVKIAERILFRVISYVSRLSHRSFLAKGEAMFLCQFIWIFTVVPVFAESYPSRPTASEMNELVILGTQCAKGVNERCWATQYSTNPAYYVAPFTNTAGFYLDQSLMGTMASKIKSLVPYYVNPDTVYNGTPNIAMLTVSELWAELAIGDHTNKFTQTFASGTNAAVYGDSPWRIKQGNLDERYDVLNALTHTSPSVAPYAKIIYIDGGKPNSTELINAMESNFWAASWSGGGWNIFYHMNYGTQSQWGGNIQSFNGGVHYIASPELGGRIGLVQVFMSVTNPVVDGAVVDAVFDANGIQNLTPNGVYNLFATGNSFPANEIYITIRDSESLPNQCAIPPVPPGGGMARGFFALGTKMVIEWNFLYCP